MENSEYPYQKAWQRHRRKAFLAYTMLTILLLMVTVVAAAKSGGYLDELVGRSLVFFFGEAARSVPIAVPMAFLLIYGLFSVNFALNLSYWRCPRCGFKTSFIRERYGSQANRIGPACIKCGLKKWEGSTFGERR